LSGGIVKKWRKTGTGFPCADGIGGVDEAVPMEKDCRGNEDRDVDVVAK
jgi:hypothetical protein